jgi:hypothetical protein
MVRIGSGDAARIAAHLGLSLRGFRSRYLAASGDRLAEGLGGRCVFLADGAVASCRIHPVRPERCRSWPFWPELADSPDALRRACRTCPGIELLPEGGG